ncbi:hypothetical protein [Chitinophaga sp.]|uniref:hypothetical protein n=1 Tax=Chitinophaga sp. TaxID=1869181 RepID=UPI0031D261E5
MELKKEIEKLLIDLKNYNWGRKEIEEEFGYNPNYISQALSRGGNDKLLGNLKKLKSRVEKEEGKDMVEYDMGAAIKKIEAMQEVTLSAVAELLAKANGQSSTVALGQLQELVNKRLNS